MVTIMATIIVTMMATIYEIIGRKHSINRGNKVELFEIFVNVGVLMPYAGFFWKFVVVVIYAQYF